MKRLLQILLISLFLLVLLTSIATAQEEKTILAHLAEDGRFTTLLKAIEITETEQAFSEGHWTLFAPTDEAFALLGLNAENMDSRLSLGETADLLLYQAMDKEMTSDDAKKMLGNVTMVNGWPAGIKWYDDSLWVNDDSRVTEANIFAANGIIHIVNQVITPPWPRSNEETDGGLLQSIEEAKLLKVEEALAETEEVDEDAEEAEEDVAVDTEEAAGDGEADTETGGGEDFSAEEEEAVVIPENSLIGVMVADGRFSTYLAAVGALDLVVPYTEGEWTLFAPTDEAFAAVGVDADNVASEYSTGELADLLLYHALDEEVSVDKAKTMLGDVTMRNGQLAGLKFYSGSLWVNDNAKVIGPDIQAGNGVIHAINEIIERPWPRVEEVIDLEKELELSIG